MTRWLRVGIFASAVIAVLFLIAPTSFTTLSSQSATSSHLAGSSPAPVPTTGAGPCSYNSAQCNPGVPLASSGSLFGFGLLVVLGIAGCACAVTRPSRRRRRAPRSLPDGRPFAILRPPRELLTAI